ncbi:probable arabinosyltransferase ARAD2 [Coccomyxa sp. Obi]|nr:probable arabinosyltransferase ARAD2 [Coccomyxa sp. Obi]
MLVLAVLLLLQAEWSQGAGGGGAKILEPFQRPDADIPHMLPFESIPGKAGRQRAHQCLRRSDRPPQATCKIYILDLSELAAKLRLPVCSEEDFVVDPFEGHILPHPRLVTRKRGVGKPVNNTGWMYPYQHSVHSQSHWAGPWFARETLRTSGNAATTLASADTVFVYDYCYLMRVLADQQAPEHWWLKDRYKPEEDYAAALLQLYRAVMSLQRWQRGGGRDFVFYHSHPSLTVGDEAQHAAFLGTICGNFQWATMLVAEQGQRWLCSSYNPRSTLIVPYSFKDAGVGQAAAQNSKRSTLLFFRGGCYSKKPGNVGLVLRRSVVTGLRELGEADVDLCCHGADAPPKVACTDANFKQNAQRTQPRAELLKDMARSQFCLVMPGSRQSSGHLADAFFTGCIPVFLGAPFHTLPLAHLINYPAIGVFMNATIAPLPWWPKREGLTFKWALTARAGMEDRTHSRWWYPEVPQDMLLPMDSMEAVLATLRGITKEQIAQKREALLTYRHLFTFNERPTHPLAASDVVAEMMCTYAKLGRRRRRRPIVPHPPIPQGF